MPERIFRAAETFEIRWIVEEIRTVGYYNIRKDPLTKSEVP